MAVKGAPITELDTAAIPETAGTDSKSDYRCYRQLKYCS